MCPRCHLPCCPVSNVIPMFGVMQANDNLKQELHGHPGAVEEALAISEDIPPPSSPAAKRSAVESNGGGPSSKRCDPCLRISALRSSPGSCHVPPILFFLLTLALITRPGLHKLRRGGAKDRSHDASLVANRYCAVVYVVEFG